MNHHIDPRPDDIRQAFRDLADADRSVRVPPRIRADVMRRYRSARPAWWTRAPWAAAAAAVIVFAVFTTALLVRNPSDRPRVPPRATQPPARVEFVLAPDPSRDVRNVSVVLARVPRATLASLGIPLADPDARGNLEVELLVGEDGVVQSVRQPMTNDRSMILER